MGHHQVELMPVVGKIFCSFSQTMLIIRKRPLLVNGGGFVATNFTQRVLFTVDGCGTLGAKGQLLLRDGDGQPILFIRKKGGIVRALCVRKNQWRGCLMDYDGVAGREVFSLRESASCPTKNSRLFKISVAADGKSAHQDWEWDLEVRGSFADRTCTVADRRGGLVAQMGVQSETVQAAGRDVYHVVVQPGHDQALVVGILAVLDNVHGESTRC